MRKWAPFALAPSGLWLPVQALPSRTDPSALHFVTTTVGWSDVSTAPVTLQAIVDRLSQYSLRQLFSMTGRIAVALSQRNSTSGQRSLDEDLVVLERLLGLSAGKYLLNDLRRSRGKEFDPARTAIFHDRQLLNALKLAMLNEQSAEHTAEVSTQPFVEALLMLNDFLDDEMEKLDVSTDVGRRTMEAYAHANLLFNRSTHDLPEIFRTHELFLSSVDSGEAVPSISSRRLLEQATGLDADEAWTALFAFYAHWASMRIENSDTGEVVMSRERYLSSLSALPPARRGAWFDLAVADVSTLQARVRSSYSLNNIRSFDVLPFEQSPLIAFDDVIFCPSVRLLQRLATSSLQYRLMDPEKFTKAETRQFLDARGRLVERYTVAAFQRAFQDRFIGERKMAALAPGTKISDGVIVYPSAIVILECKTSTPALSARHMEELDQPLAKLVSIVKQAAEQIASTLALVRKGVFSGLGIPSNVGRVFPVIATYEQLVSPLSYQTLSRDVLQRHHLSRMSGVMPVQFLDIHEVELVEVGAECGVDFSRILMEKTEDEETAAIPFHHFLHLRDWSFRNKTGSWYARRFEEIMQETRGRLRALGLSTSEDDL